MADAQTVSEIRARVEVMRSVAMGRFQADWGTRDVSAVVSVLAQTIPGSKGPVEAMASALAILHPNRAS